MKFALGVLAALFLGACSAQMVELPTPMSVTEVSDGVYQLQDSVTIKVKNARPVELRAGTRWQQVGKIDQGNVFDTKDQVVIVNSFDVHEAALVTKDGIVQGFYLKVAKTFVAAEPVSISLNEGE